MSDINGFFTRGHLAEVMKDVRRLLPGIKTREAWVYKDSPGSWEFHYGDYYWFGSAYDASEARAKGWQAYLDRKGLLLAQEEN